MFEPNCIKNLITLKFLSQSLNFKSLFTREMIRKWFLNSSRRLCDIVKLISFSKFTMNRRIKRSQRKLRIIIMNLISIIKIDNEHKSFVQHKIYYRIMKFVFKCIYSLLNLLWISECWFETTFKSLTRFNINIHCVDDYIKCCHSIIDRTIINYEK